MSALGLRCLHRLAPFGLLALRLGLGLVFVVHGYHRV